MIAMYPPDETSLPPENQRKLLEKIRRHALFLLTRRDHTRLELTQKLSRKQYPAEDIATIIQALENAGLINENRFAESYIHYRRAKGYGPRRLAMELQSKGVTDTVIAQHLEMADNAWFTDAHNAWRKQFKGRQPSDPQTRARQLRFLYNRGFTQDQILSVFKQHKIEELDE
jgi:regulatory protein